VLVGPNASGKTTFLDVIGFLGKLVTEGLEAAIEERTPTFEHLLWNGKGDSFEIAVEASIPEQRREQLPHDNYDLIRYELKIGLDPESSEISILHEKAFLKEAAVGFESSQRLLFPVGEDPPETILAERSPKGARQVLSKTLGKNDNFYPETRKTKQKGWVPSFKLGPKKCTLANLPADESQFPVTTWLKELLSEGVQIFVLNSQTIRQSSRPGQPPRFRPDGSNLPWVIERLRSRDSQRYDQWISHLRTALPDLQAVETVEDPATKHRWLQLCYGEGLRVPSWMASDGTLRMLALTLPAYLSDFSGVYLIEEPENGIHPLAMETVYQSLSSVYDAQILMATHSPVILSISEPDRVLCFQKTHQGATDIVRGDRHPNLRDWQGETNLGMLFAAGVLG
jgi:predicted ATPase